MKKNYFKPLLFASLFAFASVNVNAQDDLKSSKYQKLIQGHLSQSKYELSDSDIQNLYVDSEYLSKKTQITHVYVGQQHQGIEVFNAVSSIAVKDGKVFYVGNSFISDISEKVNTTTPVVSQLQAINTVASKFKMSQVSDLKLVKSEGNKHVYSKGSLFLEDVPVQLVYTATQNGELRLSWDLSLYALDGKHNWNARVDAITGEIIESRDYVITCDFGTPGHVHNDNTESHHVAVESSFDMFAPKKATSMVGGAEYEVYASPVESPNHGALSLEVDPENTTASPYGWHDTNGALGAEYTITRGNNAHAYEDTGNNNASVGNEPDGGASLSFDFLPNLSQSPTSSSGFAQNQQANTVNLFYWTNIMHDVYYAYGFDEAAGNFQFNNYGNGGAGNDYVLAEAQDGGGTNNANFSTPADGSNGRMQMYLWNGSPQKDGDLDNGIIAHEFGHGIHTRLGGGPANSGCMQNEEQQGEGWADWFGLMVTMEPGDVGSDGRGIGTYASGQSVNGGGIRTYRYSTNTGVNPHTYDSIKTEVAPHGVGSVWCAMLWDLTWAYVDKYGFDADLYNGTGGNNKVMQLVLDGLKLQPCSSGFVDSRDAILAADVALTGGVDQCLIWEVFAARGLGASADQGVSSSKSDGTQAFDMPSATISAIVDNSDACGASVVGLTFANYEASAISQFDYTYTIDGGAATAGSYSNSIASCSVVAGVNFDYGTLAVGTHEIIMTGTNPVASPVSFLVSVNDSGIYNVINTFETAAEDMVAYDEGGVVSTWERGASAGAVLNTASNSTSVYGTNLAGIHGDGNKFYLMSRCYDISVLENTTVEFDMAFDIEEDWDLIYLEYSTNGGASWSVLGDSTDPDWYNSSRLPNGTDCFNCVGAQWTGEGNDGSSHSGAGRNRNSHLFTHTLAAFDSTGSAETSIVFRFVYHADEAVAEEGAIIDNFVVKGDLPLSVNNNEFDKLSIFPNPTNGSVTIMSSNSLSDAKVSLYDIMGRNLTNSTNVTVIDNNNISVDINSFSGGTYFISIEDQTHKSVKQIVKY